MRTDVEIASEATLRPIEEIAEKVGLERSELEMYGSHKAKVPPEAVFGREPGQGRLVLVTCITPTWAGEGKTTVTIGLADGLRQIGRNAVACVREPSLGPVFGLKGGATGGGYSQLVPMVDINLHFTGDMHAITSAHALLSAMLDNHLHHGNGLGLDTRRITWRRAVDMNDRALRRTVVGLGGLIDGVPREDGFMITAASEVMAVLCLASDQGDLEERLGRIIVGFTRDGTPVTAGELGASGAMAMLLRDALAPNLVQSLEGTPAFVHGGPFANIAHGCNTLMATRAGLACADIVVTEAGFGSDLGAEKFYDIKCRAGGLRPRASVLVVTVRALKLHGGAARDGLENEDVEAVRGGLSNMEKHLENTRAFGVPAVVAINRFATDTTAELDAIEEACRALGARVLRSEGHARGGSGCAELAEAVVETLESEESNFTPLYELDAPLRDKIGTVASRMYGADGVDYTKRAEKDLAQIESIGLGGLPVCVAKTPASLSDDPTRLGRPQGFRITVREARPSAGAGFVVVLAGNIMVMPGLRKVPAAEGMRLTPDGRVVGLF